jgi:hypothetical protein
MSALDRGSSAIDSSGWGCAQEPSHAPFAQSMQAPNDTTLFLLPIL